MLLAACRPSRVADHVGRGRHGVIASVRRMHSPADIVGRWQWEKWHSTIPPAPPKSPRHPQQGNSNRWVSEGATDERPRKTRPTHEVKTMNYSSELDESSESVE